MGKRIVKVSRPFLEGMLRGEMITKNVTSDAPADLEICAVMQSWEAAAADQFELICHSAEWDEGTEGARFPEITINFTREYSEPVA